MPASNTKIKKICEWCGTRFEAQKISTKYCSHRCANLAYKKREREKNIKATEKNTQNRIEELPIITIKDKEFLSFSEVGILLGITRQAVYKMVYKGYLQASKISSRLSFVKRSDIDEMLKRHPYEFRMPKDTLPIKEFYTTAEIMKKFNVSESWIFVMSKKNKIPKTFNRGKTYWSKKHVDTYFSSKAPDADITEWYSVQEVQDKFQMSLNAIYSFVYKNAIPKKKVGIIVYYSKKHFDIAKGIRQAEEPKYYTVQEAMEKFKITRDQLYHYTKYHQIPKIKKGKYTLISKAELDNLFEDPIIE